MNFNFIRFYIYKIHNKKIITNFNFNVVNENMKVKINFAYKFDA